MRSRLIVAGGLLLGAASAHATFFTNEADFVAAIHPDFYLEDFTGWTDGSPLNAAPSFDAPGANGFGWTATAPPDGLFSIPNALSTFQSDEPLEFTFTGRPVTAFGGILSNTNVLDNPNAGSFTLTLSNGQSMTLEFPNTGAVGFLGWVGTDSDILTGAEISTSTGHTFGDDATAAHVYTGGPAAVPEPATLAGLSLGVLALLRRRKK